MADIIATFPTFAGVYFLPSTLVPSSTWSTKSANSHTYGSNRFTVNNLVDTTDPITFTSGDSFIGGSGNFHNYEFECDDVFEQPIYTFSLTITDQDVMGVYPNTSQGNPAINQFPDWDPAAWDR